MKFHLLPFLREEGCGRLRNGSLFLVVWVAAMGMACGPKDSATRETISTSETAGTIRMPRLDAIQAAGTGTIARAEGGWKINSDGGSAFAAAVVLWGYGNIPWSGVLEARVRVTKGEMSFGLLTSDYKLLGQRFLRAGPDVQQIGGTVPGAPCEAVLEAADLVLRAVKLTDAVSLGSITGISPATLEKGPPVRIVTPASNYVYVASMPLALGQPTGNVFLYAKMRVVRGQVGIGILNRDGRDFQGHEYLTPAPQPKDVFVPIPTPATAGLLVIRNGAAGSSEVLIDNAAVYALR
ncbi:MAG: hypothetical protein LAQ30_15280 [Acidobacteriia bacterium]|nr:hypothetical protein [Terriglobia bacterium]